MQTFNLCRSKTKETWQGNHQLSINVVNQRSDEVLGLFHRVMLCGLRLFAIFWELHVPRVVISPLARMRCLQFHKAIFLRLDRDGYLILTVGESAKLPKIPLATNFAST